MNVIVGLSGTYRVGAEQLGGETAAAARCRADDEAQLFAGIEIGDGRLGVMGDGGGDRRILGSSFGGTIDDKLLSR
jgi:hypothetical protein